MSTSQTLNFLVRLHSGTSTSNRLRSFYFEVVSLILITTVTLCVQMCKRGHTASSPYETSGRRVEWRRPLSLKYSVQASNQKRIRIFSVHRPFASPIPNGAVVIVVLRLFGSHKRPNPTLLQNVRKPLAHRL